MLVTENSACGILLSVKNKFHFRMNPLTFVLVSASLLVLAQCEDLQLLAEPSNVVNGTTKSVEVTCQAPSIDADVNLIILMQLDKMVDDVATPIASERAGGTVLLEENERITVEGALKGEKGAFLKVTIASPVEGDTGKYQCRFAFLDMALFKFSLLNTSSEITFTQPDEPTPAPVVDPVIGCSCDEVWTEVKNLRETLVADNAALREQLKSYNDSCRVSFSAQLSSTTEFRSNHPVVFNSVVSNKGNAYNAEKGIFTAPCAGQYFVRLSLRTHQENDSGNVDGAIEVDGEEVARSSVFTIDHMDHYEQASNGLVVTLAEGAEVQVRVQTNSAGYIYAETYSVFSGFFISP